MRLLKFLHFIIPIWDLSYPITAKSQLLNFILLKNQQMDGDFVVIKCTLSHPPTHHKVRGGRVSLARLLIVLS